MIIRKWWLLSLFYLLVPPTWAEHWIADKGDGTYRNPVLFADYSDPDVVKVGDDFYLVASSFNVMPGIPVLHSRDLVNWRLIGHVYDRLPLQKYDKPAHGEGSWAPSIRYHNNRFYVYFCTPHDGLFVATATRPEGPWTLEQMADVELWEDPAPFWDDDGNAYLVRGKVRADVLYLHRMSSDGKRLLDNGRVIFHDVDRQPVIEGPKMMKKDGYYYIHAPAGGVQTGWQVALRAKNIYGPYEDKVVLHTGNTAINGPHQGGLVQLDSGEWWFLHFQDRGVYGRVVHLQPVVWRDGWPVMGRDSDGDGTGEPVDGGKKPNTGALPQPVVSSSSHDDFTGGFGFQWQWHANPQPDWYSSTVNPGYLRLYAKRNLTQGGNLHFSPNLLLQKFSSPAFSASTELRFYPEAAWDEAGLLVMGRKFGYVALHQTAEHVRLGMFTGFYDKNRDATIEHESVQMMAASDGSYHAFLRVKVEEGGLSHFMYSLDGKNFVPIGVSFPAETGVWIGAKVGIFSQTAAIAGSEGYADFAWFSVHD